MLHDIHLSEWESLKIIFHTYLILDLSKTLCQSGICNSKGIPVIEVFKVSCHKIDQIKYQ